MTDLFGWDLIYKLSEKDLSKKEDVLTLFIHYALIKAGYKCIGLGEDKVLTGNEVSSETLPSEWNNFDTYSIRYSLNNNLYILKGLPVENNIVYNLLVSTEISTFLSQIFQETLKFNSVVSGHKGKALALMASDMKVTNVAFNTNSVVASLKGDLPTIIPTHEEVLKKVQAELIAPMGNGNTKEATTQATDNRSLQPSNNSGRPQPPDPSYEPPRTPWSSGGGYDPERDPLRVGRSDLDPFGIGGGMIFDPFGRRPNLGNPPGGFGIGPQLPRGAVPPGARFDPFGPSIPNPSRPRRPPGSDEFHPPGFGGDMFM